MAGGAADAGTAAPTPPPPFPPPRHALGDSWTADPDKPWFHVMPRSGEREMGGGLGWWNGRCAPQRAGPSPARPRLDHSSPPLPPLSLYHFSGWVNDPNGLAFVGGRFHAFYQHVQGSSQWDWRLEWGHASTADLATWRHEGIALTPTPGGPDAAGCWSGCLVQGGPCEAPTLLYTGVSLRGDGHGAGPPVPEAADLGLEQVEVQCAARWVGGAGDGEALSVWQKAETPIIPHAPPPGAGLAGFRDPFVYGIADPSTATPWRMVLGSGKGGRGRLLAYESAAPDPAASAWACVGVLADGADVDPPAEAVHCPGPAWDVGAMWECPFLVQVPVLDGRDGDGRGGEGGGAGEAAGMGEAAATGGPMCGAASNPITTHTSRTTSAWVLCVSPYPHTLPGRALNPPLYWVGDLVDGGRRFDLKAASGPFRLDLGDALYAPTVARPPMQQVGGVGIRPGGPAAVADAAAGADPPPPPEPAANVTPSPASSASAAWPNVPGPILMAWLHEARAGGGFDYAGCLSLPRVLSLRGGRLCQAPAPGVAGLRVGAGVAGEGLAPAPGRPATVPGADGASVDIEVGGLEGGGGKGRVEELAGWNWLDWAPGGVSLALAPLDSPSTSGHTPSLARPPVPFRNTNDPFRPLHFVNQLTDITPGTSTAVALVLRGWLHAGPESAGHLCGAALLVKWAAGTLSLVFPRAFHPSGDPDWVVGWAKEVGGPCAAVAAGRVSLRVLIDGSTVEAFACSGEALAGRVYRGGRGAGGHGQAYRLAAAGGPAAVRASVAWRVAPCWVQAADVPVTALEA